MKIPFVSNLFSRHKSPHYLVLDIGTTNVKAGIFQQDLEETVDDQEISLDSEEMSTSDSLQKNVEILGVSTQNHGRDSFRGIQPQKLDAILETCSLAIEKTVLSSGINPQKAVIISSGLIKAITSKVKLKRQNHEDEMTEKELDQLFDLIDQKIEEKSKKKAAHLFYQSSISRSQKHLAHKLKRLDAVATEFQLNGNTLSSPIGFSGQELKINLIEKYTLKKTSQFIRQIADNLALDLIQMKSTTFSPIHLVQKEYPRGILVDLGGQVSELAILDNHKITGGISFNWGGYHLTWKIKRMLDISFEQAEKIKHSAGAKDLSPERQKDIEKIIKEWLTILMTGIEEGLSIFQKNTVLPENFFIFGGAADTFNLKSAFIAYPWTKKLNFNTFPKPHFINPAKSDHLKGKISLVSNPIYAPLVGAAFSDIEG